MSQTELSWRSRLIRFSLKLLLILGLIVGGLVGSAFYLSPQDTLTKADAIIVVSGGQTRTRAERGIELYNQGYAAKLIFSGASLDDGPSNAREMRQQALRSGVPDEAILVDEAARTTFQNATNTRQVAVSFDAKTIILVTSPYHQRRTDMTFVHVFGPGYSFINQSSYDNRWSKAAWWASPFGVFITVSELAKVVYIAASQSYE